MRLLLLPVTANRSLIYCQKLSSPLVREKPRLDERIANKVGKVYSSFERSDKKWKQTIVRWTGKLLDTVQFEENGLRTLPPLNTYMRKLKDNQEHISDKHAREKDITHQLEPIELVYPSTSKKTPNFEAACSVLKKDMNIAFFRHRKQIGWCVLGLPLTIPFAINPFIPNFPGIYLAYRIWSNWKALKAAKHLRFLLTHDQLTERTNEKLNEAYKNHTTNQGRMTPELAAAINDIFKDKHLDRELQQAIRQTTPKPQEQSRAEKEVEKEQ